MKKHWGRGKRPMSLRNRFVLTSYLSIVVSIVLISIVGYQLLGRNAHHYALQSNQETVKRKCEDISTRFWNLELTMRDIIYSRDLQKILLENRTALYRNGEEVNHIISQAANSLYMIDNIAVFSEDGRMRGSMFEFDMTKNAREYPWFEEVEHSTGNTIWMLDTVRRVFDNYGYHMSVSGVKKIHSVYSAGDGHFGKELGYIYITLNLDSLLNFVEDEYPERSSHLFAVAPDSRILGSDGWTRNGIHLEMDLLENPNNSYIDIEGQTYLMTYADLKELEGASIVCLTDQTYILKDANTAIAVCVLVSVVLLAVFWCFSIHNANSLSRPILCLEKQFEMVEQGNFEITIQEKTNIREMDSLAERFQVMANRLDKLIHEVYEARVKEQKLMTAAQQARLQSLQMQINPHFLYNTLDSINWMALMEGNEEVSKMILALGHLFRSNMDTEHIFTTVRGELESVRLYMYLEQMRFDSRLEYAVEVAEGDSAEDSAEGSTEGSEGILDGVILKHLLQPLVENSIKHAIEPSVSKGFIRIYIERKENDLVVVVEDHGKGMEEAVLEDLRKQWTQIQRTGEEGSGTRGVGIQNIMKRLWLCYGERASFSMESSCEKGTKTRIAFPFSV